MIIRGRRFSASWWSVALTATGMSFFIVLGMWQLERAVLKESIESKFEQRLSEPYLLLSPGVDLKDIEYRKVLIEGSFDNAQNFLVDNQINQGRAGYYVLTPLRLKDSDQVLLVNRGWAPWGEAREEPAPILEPVSTEAIAGIAFFPSEPALEMGGVELSEPGAQLRYQLIPYIDIDALQEPFEGRLLPWVLWLSPQQQDYYVRDWDPVWMRPEKSRAYATQWFAFALIALVLFIIMNLRKIE